MRAVIQRVSSVKCVVNDLPTGEIGIGLLVLLGIEDEDDDEDVFWLAKKIAGIRIFSDENGQMNHSLADIGGDILLISQFTLFAATKKGNRPGFSRAARPEKAVPLYHKMLSTLEEITGKKVEAGIFGADMKISLTNDGPVTITIDTKNKE